MTLILTNVRTTKIYVSMEEHVLILTVVITATVFLGMLDLIAQ